MSAEEVWPTVAVTGADGQVGRALLRQLARSRYRTVALTRTPSELPAQRMVAGPLDGAAAAEEFQAADTIVHLAGTLHPLRGNSYREANLGTTEMVARGAAAGRVRRILFLSFIGAHATSRNEYLCTKALAEQALLDTGRSVVIFRCSHIVGPPEAPGPTALAMIAGPGKAANVLGSGRQSITPVFLGDVTAALEAALDAGPTGTYELVGPERMTVDELVRLVNRNPAVRIRHLPAPVARLLGLALPSLPGALVDIMLSDCTGDSSRAISAFGLTLTSLRTVWAAEPPNAAQAPATAP